MNDPQHGHTDPQRSAVDLTDGEILAFIARIQAGGGQRHYLAPGRAGDPDGESG